MKRLAWILSLAVMGCASGEESDPPQDASSEHGAPEAGVVPLFGASDMTCDEVHPPSLCLDYHAHNPWPWPEGGLVQYNILCDAGFINWDNCTVWSYDPYYYSTDTWAYCCFPPDAGAPLR